MPKILRARKDLIDPRPIRIRPGPSFYNYYWKVWALLDVNKDGEYVLPFSRRLVHSNRSLWPRSHRQPPPLGSELCGCVGCENKTWADHILKDYDDDDDPTNGNLHIEEVYIESEDEDCSDEKQNGTSKDGNDYSMSESDGLPSSTTNDINMEGDDDDDDDVDKSGEQDLFIGKISDPPSSFTYDPYESYDLEC